MPIRRKYGSKKRFSKGRKGFKRTSRVSKQVYRLARQVRALRPELKYSDNMQVALADTAGSWSPVTSSSADQPLITAGVPNPRVYLLNGLSPGTGRDARIGWKVNNRFINAKFKLAVSESSASDNLARVRFRVIMFMNRNQEVLYTNDCPKISQILLNTSATSSTDEVITSHYQPSVRSQWSILHDRVYTPQSVKGLWINTTIRKRLHSMSLYTANTSQSSANNYVGRGAIYIMFIAAADTDQGTPADIDCSLDLQSRFYYTDA